MKFTNASALTLLISVVLSACAYSSLGSHGPIGPSTQIVTGKSPPHMLYAESTSYCEVSDDKFKKTEIGSSAFCVWRSSDDKGRAMPSGAPKGSGH